MCKVEHPEDTTLIPSGCTEMDIWSAIEKRLKSASFCPKNPANLDTGDLSKFSGVSG